MEDVRKKGVLCLIVKVWVDRALGKGIIETDINKIWRLSSKVIFREVGPNTFNISFATHANKQKVKDGLP